MPALSALPTEMLHEIFASLPHSDLLNACLISHRFQPIVLSYLYRDIHLTPSRIFFFVRTILAREDVAQHVRRIGSTWPVTGACQWHAVQLSLLLHLLPNLQVFDCPPHDSQDDLGLLNTFSTAITSDTLSVGLQSLHEIHNDFAYFDDDESDTEGDVSLTMLLAMMMLPSIQKIKAHLVGCDPPEDFHLTYAAHSGKSTVVNLNLGDWWMTPDMLNMILQVPRALTHFSFYHTGFFSTVLNDPMVNIAFRHLRITLEFLALDFSHLEIEGGDGDLVLYHTVGSLRNWPLLAHIRSPLLPLLGMPGKPETLHLVEVLPLVITRLDFDNDAAWPEVDFVDEIVRLVEQREAYGLTRLLVVNVTHWRLHNEGNCQRVEAACMTAGIKFGVVSYDWETEVPYRA